MNKALVLKSGWGSASGGPVSAKALRIMSASGGAWDGLRHHTASHSPCGDCQGEAEHLPRPYFCVPSPFLGWTCFTEKSISQHCIT